MSRGGVRGRLGATERAARVRTPRDPLLTPAVYCARAAPRDTCRGKGTLAQRRATLRTLSRAGSDVLPRVRERDSVGPGYVPEVAHYLFNFVTGDAAEWPALREQAAGFLRARMWGIHAGEPHSSALAAGDLVLIYLGAPGRKFIGCAALASAIHDWTP